MIIDNDKTNTPAPVDTGSDGIAIHLSYIRRDIDEIKNTQTKNNTEIKQAIQTLQNAYVTRVDYNEHLKTDEDHEKRIRILERALWKYIGFSSAISAVISLVGAFLAQHYFN